MNKNGFHLSVKKEGCPIHPIRNGSPNWCQSVVDRDSSSLCVSLGHVGVSSWWCRLVTVCQFARDLEKLAVLWCVVKTLADRPQLKTYPGIRGFP